MSVPAPDEGPRTWVRVAQVAASAAVIAVLVYDVDLPALGSALRHTTPGLLLVALLCKSVSLLTHELRLWLVLPVPRPRLRSSMSIGFTAGALNLVLPGRGGDVAAIALLHRELGVPAGKATGAVAIASFLEAAVFGLLLLGVMVAGAARWELVVGHAAHAQAVSLLTLITLGGVAVAVGTVIFARLFGRPTGRSPSSAAASPARRLLGFVRDAVTSTGSGLSDLRLLTLNTALAVVQVLAVVAAVTLTLPAVGIHVPLPWLAGSGVLAISSMAAIVLPSTYAAGPAAASVAVLSVFGVAQADALAYAVLWWVVAQVPPALFGIPAIWQRRLRARASA